MFRRSKLSQASITVLDVHTTSPGHVAPAANNSTKNAPIGEPKTELFVRANQIYLRSRLTRLRKGSSSIV